MYLAPFEAELERISQFYALLTWHLGGEAQLVIGPNLNEGLPTESFHRLHSALEGADKVRGAIPWPSILRAHAYQY